MGKNSNYEDYPPQPNNPTDEQRYLLARYALGQKSRLEDFENIKDVTSPPIDITTIVQEGGLKGCKVGIIGGGLAGMSAAFELRKLGCDITIFDAQERIGGRVYTYYFDHNKKHYGEFGAARIPVTHETTWHYINLFKLPTIPFIQVNENSFIYLRDVRVRNDPEGRNVQNFIYPKYDLTMQEKKLSWQQLISYGLDNALLYASPEVRREVAEVLNTYSPQILYWDFNSNRNMAETLGLSEEAINLISNFIISAGANLFAGFVDYIQEPYSVDLSFVYQLEGGNVNLPMAFYKALLSEKSEKFYGDLSKECLGNVVWKSAHAVNGIYMDSEDGKPILSSKSLKTNNSLHEKFDYLICAIPFSTLRNIEINPLFSNIKMQAIKEVYYTPAHKSLLFCRKRFWEEGGPKEQIIGGISYTDMPISQILYPSNHVYSDKKALRNIEKYYPYYNSKFSEDGPGVLAIYNFNLDTVRLANMTENERFEEIKREIEKIHGLPRGCLDKIVADCKTVNWNSEPWFRGGLCMFTPEQKRLYSYAAAYPEYNGRVFFAGEHISSKHRWMQGALKTGMEAANSLAYAFKYHNT